MSSEEDAMMNIYKKIEREKALINAANAMRQQTNNDDVRSRLDSQMREGRRNLQFFEEKLRDLQMRRLGQGVDNMSLNSGTTAVGSSPSIDLRGDVEGAPTPPPKDAGEGDRNSYGSGGYGQAGRPPSDMMPPRAPYAAPGPGSGAPKARPNFTKLGKIPRMHSPSHHGPRRPFADLALLHCRPYQI
jgi:hypothetical protein